MVDDESYQFCIITFDNHRSFTVPDVNFKSGMSILYTPHAYKNARNTHVHDVFDEAYTF